MYKLLFSLLAFLFAAAAFSQKITGNWEGLLEIQGNQLPLVFHIMKDSSGKLTATFDSPKQKAFNIACSDVMSRNDSLFLFMENIKGRYEGKLNAEKTQLSGTWLQSGYSFPLDMNKTGDAAGIKKINRPQTPRPPFPYKSEDVEYKNADKSIRFGATFTVPLPDPNVDYFRAPVYPTVILITGSGAQDRDESILGHKPFAVIADHLTRQGIAVLRVDDRGTGKTTGQYKNSTTADFANDVEAGIEYLKTRDDVEVNSIGLLGHSEGGLIAPMIAAKRKDVNFIILLAGPGIKIVTMMDQQNYDVLAASGVSKADRDLYRPLYKNLLADILNEPDSVKAKQKAITVFNKWRIGKADSTIKNTTGVTDEKSLNELANEFVKQISDPWFNYFLKMNPADNLSKVQCAVLAINGEKDIQVASNQNLDGITTAMATAKNKKIKTLEMPGLNHLFQHCKTCSIEEYAELEETFDTATLQIISDWIKTGRFN